MNRVVGMVLHRRKTTPHRHHAVADILVDHAQVVLDTAAQQGKMMVEHVGRFLLRQLLGLRREAHDVGEHHGDDPPARRHRILAQLHQSEDETARHIGAEPFQRPTCLVEAVPGIVDLAQPRLAVERLVELELLDQLRGRGQGADGPRHAEPHHQRQQRGDGQRDAADDSPVGQPVEVAGRILDREILPDQPGLGAEPLEFAIDEHPAPTALLDDVPQRSQRPVDLRRPHGRVPDLGEDGVVHLLDGGQGSRLGEAEPAGIDQPARRQHMVATDEDEIAPVAAAHRIADEIGEIADGHRGDQAADEGIVDAPHRRAHVDHRLLDGLAPEQGAPESVLRRLELTEALHALRLVDQR